MSEALRKPVVLVVEDTATNLALLQAILKGSYELRTAENGPEALRAMAQEPLPDLVLMDIVMPGVDGLEVCRQFKRDPRSSRVPVIFITALDEIEDEAEGFEVGAVDYITKPFSPALVKARVKTHLALYDQRRALEDAVAMRTSELRHSRLEVIRRLGRAAGYRDNDSGLSVVRMSHYALLLAESIGLSEDVADTIFHAAPLHDIGKIGIPEAILQKPGALSEEEWRIMKEHTTIGALIIGKHEDPMLDMARTIAWCHHEKWDGSGYPNAMEGEEIPLEARIVALADVFDSLTCDRPYKKAWPVEQAFELIRKAKGTHFEPRLADHFLALAPEILEIRDRYPEPSASPMPAKA